jgi:hypothetical protein
MLPSGNDAAHLLAEHFGGILKKEAEEREETERKEELIRIKQEEEKAAKAALAGEEGAEGEKPGNEHLSNSASNQYLPTQDKETNA